MKTTLLLDADVPAYQFAARGQKEIVWDEGDEEVRIPPPTDMAIDAMYDYINDLKAKLEADRVVLCFSDSDRKANWRLDVLPTYKWKRDPKARPVLHEAMEAALGEHFESIRRPRLEGDDVLGILATNRKVIKGRKIIATIDKDLKTIPSRKQRGSDNLLFHMSIKNPKQDRLVRVTEGQADWYWMYQTIIGDTTDGYKGCPGAGPAKACQLLGDYEDAPDDTMLPHWWKLVVELYESKGLTEADALQQARVARIARHEDFDYKHKVVIPWTPND